MFFFFHLPQKKKPKTSPTTINPPSPPPSTFADVNYIANHRLPPLYAPQIKTCYVSTILTLCFFFSSTQKKKKKKLKMSPTTINSRNFLKNNYKTQTISLVSKRFKLISFITIWVQWTRFRKNWCEENMEIEFNELGFHVQKSSSMNLVSMYRNRVCWTRFPYIETEFIELGFWVLFQRVEFLKMELLYL